MNKKNKVVDIHAIKKRNKVGFIKQAKDLCYKAVNINSPDISKGVLDVYYGENKL